MKISEEILDNGIKIISSPSVDTRSVTVFVMVKTGSRNEKKKIMGISHFLEHMAFKGTKKRPSSLDVSRDIESLGAYFNAYTDKEITGYHIKTVSSHFKKACEILQDIVFKSSLKDQAIKLEKGVILEEKKMYEENPIMHSYELFENLYFTDPRLAQDVVGTNNSINDLKRNDFIRYIDKYYQTGNIIISVAGNLPKNYKEVLNLVFGKVKQGSEEKWDAENGKKKKEKKENIIVEYKDNKQSNLVLGYPGVKFTDKNYLTLRVLSLILGGGLSSRLFQKIRVEKGLAYEIYSSLETYSDDGYIYIKTGIDSDKVDNSLSIMQNELKNLNNNLKEKEMYIAKEIFKGMITFEFEDSFKRANFYAKQKIYHMKIENLDQILKNIEKIKLDDVKKMAKKVFSERPTLAVIGPFKNAEKFAKILK